jgi:hypothetical protein
MADARNQGGAKKNPAKAVFINCPFDKDFVPLFEAVIFAVKSCDFNPRSALETGTVSEPRIERIIRAIFTSKYSIHDLSRCQGEGDERLARFNMPLELGIAMARRYQTRGKDNQHDWLLLAPDGHVYVKVISDLAGFDPMKHDGTVETIVQRVVTWLATRQDITSKPTPTPEAVLDALPAFQAEVEQLKKRWGPEPPWTQIVEAAGKTALKFL